MARVRVTFKAIVEDPETADKFNIVECQLSHEYNLFTAVGAVVTDLLGDYSVVSISVDKLEG